MTNTACIHGSSIWFPPIWSNSSDARVSRPKVYARRARGKLYVYPSPISPLIALQALRRPITRILDQSFFPGILVACEIRWSAFLHARSLISWMGPQGMAGMMIGWDFNFFLYFLSFSLSPFFLVSLGVWMTFENFHEIKLWRSYFLKPDLWNSESKKSLGRSEASRLTPFPIGIILGFILFSKWILLFDGWIEF